MVREKKAIHQGGADDVQEIRDKENVKQLESAEKNPNIKIVSNDPDDVGIESENVGNVPNQESSQGNVESVNDETVKENPVIDKQNVSKAVHMAQKKENDQVTSPQQVGKSPLITKILFSSLVIGSVAVSSYWFFLREGSEYSLLDFNKAAGKPSLVQAEMLRFKLELDTLKQNLSGLENLQNAVADMKNTNINLQNQINAIRNDLASEVESFEKTSRIRDEEVSKIKQRLIELTVTGSQDKEQLATIEIELRAIEKEQEEETEKIETKLSQFKKLLAEVASTPKQTVTKTAVTPKREPAKTKNESSVERVTSIGYLSIDNIVTFGAQKIVMLSDGISGALQVIEGDVIGTYTVIKVNDDDVLLRDQSGKKVLLIKKEG
ncbi:hypothetical protein [Enterovibrio norvegicus]|uniref:hypothetical protein n=1 Tax=Enterovibrio norvegicus TaxID=188144 RepID=UPI000C83B95C|nr:hypothetical protein [Enterovibrio norvegicus]PMH64563.1 hypothetical protein BCU62_16030 [Enterovibrio norvegicus]